ncbi:MAG: hypothetical protein ACRC1E_09095 [Craterilacuibacter sp.]
MHVDSRFFFIGSAVLTLIFFLSGDWVMLVIPFFISLAGIYCAEQEQINTLDSMTLTMLASVSTHDMLSCEQFVGLDLLFYQAGCPVYRELLAGEVHWVLVGPMSDMNAMALSGSIHVFPGFVYRRA